jgi:lipopolysaccharide export system permease protein
VPAALVGELVLLSARQNATVILPIAVLLGTVLGLGRLYHDSEIAAAQACGIGTAPLYRSAGLLAVLAAGLCGWIALVSGPSAMVRATELRQEALRTAVARGLSPGQFRSLGGSVILNFASQDEDGLLREVFVQRAANDSQHPGQIEVVTAERARYALSADSSYYTVTLYDGQSHVGVPGQGQWRQMRFAEQAVRLQTPSVTVPGGTMRIDAMPTTQLLGSSDVRLRTELHWRLSPMISALLLGLLAVPVAKLRPRQGRYARVVWALLLYAVYAGLLILGQTLMQNGRTPAWLGLWWVHAVACGFGLAMINLPRLSEWRSRQRMERALKVR